MNNFQILPAIDLKEGRAVRLYQGNLSTDIDYGDPIAVAAKFVAAGAKWLHVVDLDAAFGRGSNADLIAEIVAKSGILIEVSGGLRDDQSLNSALATGCARVILGTAAIENPDWCATVIGKYGEKIAVGLDVRGHDLTIRGWTETAGDIFEAITRLDSAGCARYVVTDVSKDGTLSGPNLALLSEVAQFTDKPIIASGGVSKLEDIADIAEISQLGIEGVIVGKAIYEGAFSLEEAIARFS